jgi:hypothetical protein
MARKEHSRKQHQRTFQREFLQRRMISSRFERPAIALARAKELLTREPRRRR